MAVNTEQYSFFTVGIFNVYALFVMEGHRQTLFIQRLFFFLVYDFELLSYKRIFAREEEVKKKKKKKKVHLTVFVRLVWHLFLCPPVALRKIMVLIEHFFCNGCQYGGSLPAMVLATMVFR